ncbi:hypothetical protein LAZ67_7003592 [Cordylochernes scorpioides]|uniref:CUB domain-containing protein n=1 Tax=Cordylochernes scorpioides TaxID=51811 RepID=A0ABY6KPF5_9ARAC|nr:hypothetical protein LAZ67_7003592 [Cordylochernes scorpioides]
MLYVLGEKEPLMELRNEVRELYLPAKSGYRLEVSRNCSSGSVLRASYDIQPDCSAAKTVAPGNNLTLTSPNYPDHYPLNARCTTSLNTTGKVLLVTVSSLDLAPQHSLKVGWGSNISVELEQAKDVLVPASSLQLTLLGRGDKQPLDPAGLTASGYSLSVLAADCGANLTTPSNSFNSSNASICVLIIEVGNGSLVNYTLSTPQGGEVKVYDGPSLLSPAATSQTGDLLSRTSSLVVVYRKLNATSPLTLKYTSYKCEEYCLNKVCMQPHWRCNDRNDCGDWSDELHCQGPAPAAAA